MKQAIKYTFDLNSKSRLTARGEVRRDKRYASPLFKSGYGLMTG
jgi:hypothetical protein